MIIDCDSCVMQLIRCDDCVISSILQFDPQSRDAVSGGAVTPNAVELDGCEQAAIGALVRGGLVPPLRLVRAAHVSGLGHHDCQASRAG